MRDHRWRVEHQRDLCVQTSSNEEDDPSDWELRKGSTPTLHATYEGDEGKGMHPIGEEDKESHHEGKECHRL